MNVLIPDWILKKYSKAELQEFEKISKGGKPTEKQVRLVFDLWIDNPNFGYGLNEETANKLVKNHALVDLFESIMKCGYKKVFERKLIEYKEAGMIT